MIVLGLLGSLLAGVGLLIWTRRHDSELHPCCGLCPCLDATPADGSKAGSRFVLVRAVLDSKASAADQAEAMQLSEVADVEAIQASIRSSHGDGPSDDPRHDSADP